MKLIDFLGKVNYDNFCISKEKNGEVEVFCRINKDVPFECLSHKLLNSEIENIFIDEEFKENKNDLIDIVINWED